MYERIGEKLLPWPDFVKRMAFSGMIASLIVAVALAAGAIGYRYVADLNWIDAVLNASMILTGMGPVDPMKTVPAKLFASAYALFSGVIFLSAVGVVIAPIFHRLLHTFHLDDDT